MLWGAIADDVTGATDLATNLVSRGLRTVVVFGPLDAPERRAAVAGMESADAIIVALKSRTAPVHDAVAQSVEAARLLQQAGAQRFYFKYCSTFDSTPRGNIGPVMDALLTELGEQVTIVVPSFPDAGRTVYRGHLFVYDELLSESPMRHHPLTPMTDSSVPRLLAAQSSSEVRTIPISTVREGSPAVSEQLRALAGASGTTAVVVDAIENGDLVTVMEGAASLRLVTGGSGLALGLAAHDRDDARRIPVVDGFRAVLCGSASLRTREQVARAREALPWRKLDLDALDSGFDAEVSAIVDWMRARWRDHAGAVPLVYSAGSPEDVARDRPGASELVERALGAIASRAVAAGLRQLVVAGGESSGRVIADLGVQSLRIGPSIAPGVAWAAATTDAGETLDLALKSGNFGERDLFVTAWRRLESLDERGTIS